VRAARYDRSDYMVPLWRLLHMSDTNESLIPNHRLAKAQKASTR
jgi:hypothetical protein